MQIYEHQQKAIDFILERNGSGALFLDCGLGKTVIALKVFEELRKINPALKLIAVMPLSILEAAWGNDIKQFTTYIYYNAHLKPLPKTLNEDILLINYEAAITSKNKDLWRLAKNNLLIADESGRLKNNQSKTCKTLLCLSAHAKRNIVMTATPAPNTPLEYWGQIEMVRPKLLHTSGSFYAFRNSYFHLQRGNQIMRGKLVTKAALMDAFRTGFKYQITTQNLARLMDKISQVGLAIKKEDCLDLPDQVDEVRYVYLDAKHLKHYRELKNELITEIEDNFITAEMALIKVMKLREVTSSFLLSGIKEIEIGECLKLKELKNLIEELGDRQLIVWCNFKWEIRKVTAELSKLAPTVALFSETKDRDAQIEAFKTGAARYAVCHSASVGHGITWVNCSTQVFFSLDYSWERWYQARARIHRIGQTEKCTYIHLLAKDTIDEDIYRVLQDKGKMAEIVTRMVKHGQ